jgi:hypothetical protein
VSACVRALFLALSLAVAVCFALPTGATTPTTQAFSYTGATQTFTVPAAPR